MSCALIAIKARARCKSRLAEVLAPAARLELVRGMLDAVLCAARAARTLRQIVVVSPERDSVPADIPVLADAGIGLNESLSAAQRVLHQFGCHELVVLPADLPEVTAMDIDALVRAGRSGGFAIATDAAGVGTNALYLNSPRPFRFRFGLDSRRLHLEQARGLGLDPHVVPCAGLEFDVDSPEDLERLKEPAWHTRLQA
ncbi:MAG TPA: 2-phospho-L-lactate guanylyltransferase [Steroidobacteraceae bacterium]|nr:2-phospho-L-lactate guanylyltransferase [Steroidobacteraceae bacterium]